MIQHGPMSLSTTLMISLLKMVPFMPCSDTLKASFSNLGILAEKLISGKNANVFNKVKSNISAHVHNLAYTINFCVQATF